MPRALTRCPNCGQSVTPYAAGCAVCGEDLEAARARLAAQRRPELPRLPALATPSRIGRRGTGEISWFQIAVALLLALFGGPIGLLLDAFWSYQQYRRGATLMMWAMLTATALAVGAILAPFWFWQHITGKL